MSLDELRSINPDLAASIEAEQAALDARIEETLRTAKVEAADNEVNEASQAIQVAEEALNAARVRFDEAQAARAALDPVVEAPVEDVATEDAPVEDAEVVEV